MSRAEGTASLIPVRLVVVFRAEGTASLAPVTKIAVVAIAGSEGTTSATPVVKISINTVLRRARLTGLTTRAALAALLNDDSDVAAMERSVVKLSSLDQRLAILEIDVCIATASPSVDIQGNLDLQNMERFVKQAVDVLLSSAKVEVGELDSKGRVIGDVETGGTSSGGHLLLTLGIGRNEGGSGDGGRLSISGEIVLFVSPSSSVCKCGLV
jgi:hypothetical protein